MSGRIAGNKKAYHDYFIDETFEAGIALTGTEVKSIRDYGLSLKESYAHVRDGEAWLLGVHIKPYTQGSYNNVDPDRPRKLLLHKKQIRYLDERTSEKGQTIVPTKIYFSRDNKVKVEIGLARGKKNYDKRATIAKKDAQRDIERALKTRSQ
ncbi:MAG: SsrA-binding protein SmpB [Coriobacteriia bacterium]|nr:SsrA-binding protein SmpB [Coriobacteriia bacterium]MCL2870099.1 SsrA-binding protein SmpB [Coriobacteriia bacterium]